MNINNSDIVKKTTKIILSNLRGLEYSVAILLLFTFLFECENATRKKIKLILKL